MDKFDRHIGNGKAIEIGEDTFVLKPLGVQHMKDFFRLMKKFEGAKTEGDFLKNIDDQTSETISSLVMATLKKSYPDVAVEKLEEFGMRNFSTILQAIFEINLEQDNTNPALDFAKKMKTDVQNKA